MQKFSDDILLVEVDLVSKDMIYSFSRGPTTFGQYFSILGFAGVKIF